MAAQGPRLRQRRARRAAQRARPGVRRPGAARPRPPHDRPQAHRRGDGGRRRGRARAAHRPAAARRRRGPAVRRRRDLATLAPGSAPPRGRRRRPARAGRPASTQPPRSPRPPGAAAPSRGSRRRRCSTHRSPESASRRSAEPSASWVSGDQAISGTDRSGRPGTTRTAASDHDPVLRGALTAGTSRPPPARAGRRPAPTPRTSRVTSPIDRGHQPAGEGDLAVLRAAPVGQLRLALGVVERLGLALEVVEQREQVVLPAHGRTLRPAAACG